MRHSTRYIVAYTPLQKFPGAGPVLDFLVDPVSVINFQNKDSQKTGIRCCWDWFLQIQYLIERLC